MDVGESRVRDMRSHDEHADSDCDPVLLEELDRLLASLCDDILTDSDRQRLNQILGEHAAARSYYLRNFVLHNALAMTAGSPVGCFAADVHLAVERLTLERFAGCMSATARNELASLSDRVRPWHAMVKGVISISAVLLIGFAWWFVQRVDQHDERLNTVAATDDPPAETDFADDQPLVAEVTYVSNPAIWQNPNGSYAFASRIRSGHCLTIERGQIELTYLSGAKLLLTGPSEFLVHPTGGKLRRGELVARVPQAGHGFTVETPHGKVIDLGTEFGVVVDDFGISQVSVFEGKVETVPARTDGTGQDKIELTSGRAIQWSEDAIIPIDVRGRRYQRLSEESPAGPAELVATGSWNQDFRVESLASDRWTTLGEVSSSSRGLRLGGSTAAEQRPYLLSAQEFDPSRGAITIVCDLRFEDAHDVESASFAILTRSSDQLSKSGTLWQDMLARSVRCRLEANLQSGEGRLEVGTKHEADRELSNLSWGGFSRPQPDALYRLEVRDDGLNVSFTVSLVENPSVRKTISCRSLFRGNQNFIALEGTSSGTTVVERLSISQEISPLDNDKLVGSQMIGRSPEHGVSEADSAKQLDALTPADAELVLRDSFDHGKLNSKVWTTLGDVVMLDGQVQLGLPNEERHIDTWKARPYLLTRERFQPAARPLTILGKVTFAENYLHGYGGSFAVMTRSDNVHGGGPGWENSILRRGVRFNFWPAAYGFDHSLEIHEKPSPNTISLLVAEGFPIAPNSRSYFFQIFDDGRSATLTYLDSQDPTLRKTISHPTSSASSMGGHIGFESCWGSPVTLDDIRIFRATDLSD